MISDGPIILLLPAPEWIQVLWPMHLHAHGMSFPNPGILVLVQLPSSLSGCPIRNENPHSTKTWCFSLTIYSLVQ
jgi:hypothetical protein